MTAGSCSGSAVAPADASVTPGRGRVAAGRPVAGGRRRRRKRPRGSCGRRRRLRRRPRPSPVAVAAAARQRLLRVAHGRGDHLVFDAGPHGFLNGGHAHADALAVVLTVGGEPLLVDPGTATYTMDSGDARPLPIDARCTTRSCSTARNTSMPRGPFHWQTPRGRALPGRADRRATSTSPSARTTATADRRHVRAVLALHGVGWLIVDQRRRPSRPARAQIYWHLHPAWRAAPAFADATRRRCVARAPGRAARRSPTTRAGRSAHRRRTAELVVRYRARIRDAIEPSTHAASPRPRRPAAPFTIGTFIPAMRAAGRSAAWRSPRSPASASRRSTGRTADVRDSSNRPPTRCQVLGRDSPDVCSAKLSRRKTGLSRASRRLEVSRSN